MKTVYWVSRHDLSPAQIVAIVALHGEVCVVKDPVVFTTVDGLADYIREREDCFVYAVAGAPHYLAAALAGLRFGVFENHPQRRQDGSFGLSSVYHVVDGELQKVWSNSNPMSDVGEALAPVAR